MRIHHALRAASNTGADLYALEFGGQPTLDEGDCVDVSSITLLDTVTVECWVKIYAFDTGARQSLITSSNYRDFASGHFLEFTADGASLRWYTYDGNNALGFGSVSSPVTVGNWHHVAAVVKNNGDSTYDYKLYVDGVLLGLMTDSYAPENNWHFGAQSAKIQQSVNGVMSNVRFWDDERTQSEIQSNANAELSGTEANLVACYPLETGSGTTAVDITGNHNGSFVNNPAWVERTAFPQI